MPVSLATALQNTTEDVDLAIINEFRVSELMDLISFDEAVNPAGGGATLTYTYRRETALGTAKFRAINTEYEDQELPATSRHSVDLHPLGGSFRIDRLIAPIGPSTSNELNRNMAAKIQAARALFADSMINGDTVSGDANGFDGLSKALAGTATEITDAIDWSGEMNESKGYTVLETLDALIDELDGLPGAIISNKAAIGRIKAAARRTSQYVEKPGPAHTMRAFYGNIALVDAGRKAGDNKEIIPLTAGVAPIYAVRFALDGFHGVTVPGVPLVRYWLPDFSTSGAVKRGEVEMAPVAVALKKTKAAGVLRNVKLK